MQQRGERGARREEHRDATFYTQLFHAPSFSHARTASDTRHAIMRCEGYDVTACVRPIVVYKTQSVTINGQASMMMLLFWLERQNILIPTYKTSGNCVTLNLELPSIYGW